MTRPVEPDIHTLAAPYALHALPGDEVTLFEAHLRRCAACRAEVDDLREAVARLGAARTVVPPPELKGQVLARVSEIRPLPPARVPAETGGRSWWPRIATGLVAALVAGIVVLGIRLDGVQDELDRSQTTAAMLQDLVEAPDLRTVRVDSGDTRETLLVSRSLDMAVLIADGMAPAPEGQTYQLWFLGPDGARSAGMLTVPADGEVGPVMARGLGSAEQLGMTMEPTGGSEQPTGDPMMTIELPA